MVWLFYQGSSLPFSPEPSMSRRGAFYRRQTAAAPIRKNKCEKSLSHCRRRVVAYLHIAARRCTAGVKWAQAGGTRHAPEVGRGAPRASQKTRMAKARDRCSAAMDALAPSSAQAHRAVPCCSIDGQALVRRCRSLAKGNPRHGQHLPPSGDLRWCPGGRQESRGIR